MATIERPHSAQVVAHATEYPADRDGDGTGYDRRKKRNTAERHETQTGGSEDNPAVLVESHPVDSHALDGVAAYRAAALSALEPSVDHGPVNPLRGPWTDCRRTTFVMPMKTMAIRSRCRMKSTLRLESSLQPTRQLITP